MATKRTKVKSTIRVILSLFTPEEIRLLACRDANRKYWSFRQQIEDRFKYQCASLASLSSIRIKMQQILNTYRPILRTNVESVREILLNEMSEGIFISRNSYLWNLEVLKNIDHPSSEQNKEIADSVQKIISQIKPSQLKLLNIKYKGVVYDFRSQLLARWQNAWRTGFSRSFSKYLRGVWLNSKHSPKYWPSQPGLINVEMQAFLQEVDKFFLYPGTHRKVKWLMGRSEQWRWISWRKCFLYYPIYFPEGVFTFTVALIIFLLIVLC